MTTTWEHSLTLHAGKEKQVSACTLIRKLKKVRKYSLCALSVKAICLPNFQVYNRDYVGMCMDEIYWHQNHFTTYDGIN